MRRNPSTGEVRDVSLLGRNPVLMSVVTSRIGARLQADPVRFSFDGREYTGQRGDTAASALLAHGIRLLGSQR